MSELSVVQEDIQLLGLLVMASVLAVLASQKGVELPARAQPQHPPGQLIAPMLLMNEQSGPEALGVRRGVAEPRAANCSITAGSADGKCIFFGVL